jgi:hypothetical protein
LSGVSVVETILVYAVIPLAVVGLFAVLTLIPGRAKKARYKPGQPWDHAPVWWEPHPVGGGHGGAHAIEAGHGATALGAPAAGGPLGGARGTW